MWQMDITFPSVNVPEALPQSRWSRRMDLNGFLLSPFCDLSEDNLVFMLSLHFSVFSIPLPAFSEGGAIIVYDQWLKTCPGHDKLTQVYGSLQCFRACIEPGTCVTIRQDSKKRS